MRLKTINGILNALGWTGMSDGREMSRPSPDIVRREEPGADRAATARLGEIRVAEYLVGLQPKDCWKLSCTRLYGW